MVSSSRTLTRPTGSLVPALDPKAPCFRLPSLLALAAALAMLGAIPAMAANGNGNGNGNGSARVFAKGHILVAPASDASDADFNAALAQQGGRGLGKLARSNIELVDVPVGTEEAVVAKLAKHKKVKFAEVDLQITVSGTPNDPGFASEWHLPRINAPAAWDLTNGAGVTIAILDTGVDGTHPDLAPNMVAGWNFYDNNADTSDVHGHGTAVAGAAAAAFNNGVGVSGVAGGAKIMPLRVADPTAFTYWSTCAQAITYAADHGARIVNLSYVGASSSSTIQSAASYLRSKGGVLFVAAGNTGAVDSTAPTSLVSVVSATQESDQIASFSTFGSFVTISAPGNNIYTTTRGGGYANWWGTSLASPVAAGTAALIVARRPDFTAAQIDSTLQASAVDLGSGGTDIYFGAGRVDAAAAVNRAGSTAPAPDTTPPTVAIASPTGGAATGVVSIAVNASDNIGVTRVDLRINGNVVASDSSAPYQFNWDSTTVSNGVVAVTAVAYDAAGNAKTSTQVSLTVSNAPPADTTPPSVAIATPQGGTVSGIVTVTVNASDNVGVARVDLLANGATVGTTNTSPYQFAWDTRSLANASYSLTAVAYDAAGNAKTSTAIAVSVSNVVAPPLDKTAPVASIASPLGGSVSGVATVVVNASDNVGVTRVDLMVNGTLLTSKTTGPWTFAWDTTTRANATVSLTAIAYDAAGNSATSSPVAVTVANVSNPPAGPQPDTTPPAVAFTSPTAGTVSGTVAVAVSASDNVGVARVDFKVNGTVVASSTSVPYQFAWNSGSVANGAVTLSATAYDAAGNATTTSQNVTVSNGSVASSDTTLPTVTISNPLDGSNVNGNVTISTTASDNNGASGITQVLYIDGAQKDSVKGAKLSYQWNAKKASVGLHTIMVTATDAAGNSTSQQVQVRRK